LFLRFGADGLTTQNAFKNKFTPCASSYLRGNTVLVQVKFPCA